MMPTLPFIYLIVALASYDFLELLNQKRKSKYILVSIFVGINIFFSSAYFITAFVEKDTRVAASEFAQKTMASDSIIMSEVYDLGIVPFNMPFPKITLVNTYDLDNNSPTAVKVLDNSVKSSSYIILPSQRVVKTRLINQKQFPKGYAFYNKLLSGKLGYQKIYETPCDIFCKITYLGDPVYRFEETANVFDRPEVYIFKKQK
jgi:hypothetical protein